MTKYTVKFTTQFKKDYKLAMKRGLDINLLDTAITLLAETGTLPEEYLDHPLSGNYKGFRECHILPNWLLVYLVEEATITLTLARIGSHSDLFKHTAMYFKLTCKSLQEQLSLR